MDPATGEIPRPPHKPSRTSRRSSRLRPRPLPAQQQPATQAQPADEDDGLDDWRVAFDGCQTAADCDDLIAGYRGKPGSDEAKACARSATSRRKARVRRLWRGE